MCYLGKLLDKISEALPHSQRFVHGCALHLYSLVDDIVPSLEVDQLALLQLLVQTSEAHSEDVTAHNGHAKHGRHDTV